MSRHLFLGAAFVVLTTTPVLAVGWNLNSDSDATTNPQGVWSFGYSGDALDPAPFEIHTNMQMSGSGLRIWNHPLITGAPGNNPHPNIAFNTTGGVLEGHIQPGQFNMHPGPEHTGDYAKIRWTAPGSVSANQQVAITGFFHSGGGGLNDFHVLHNDNSLFDVLDSPDTEDLDLSATIGPGDTIDFVVGHGSNNSEGGDATSVDFIIIPIELQVDFEWQTDNSAAWTTGSNWSPSSVPGDSEDPFYSRHSATFGSAITANRTVTLDSPVSLRAIKFVNSSSYAIAGHGSVNLVADTAAPPDPTELTIGMGNHQFQAVVNLENDTTVTIANNSLLEFNNRLNLNGNTLTKIGPGTMAVSNMVVTGDGTIDLQSGVLVGPGAIGGDVVNDGGTISPGPPAVATNVVPEPTTMTLLWLATIVFFAVRGRLSTNT